jgi:hypothetical protein
MEIILIVRRFRRGGDASADICENDNSLTLPAWIQCLEKTMKIPSRSAREDRLIKFCLRIGRSHSLPLIRRAESRWYA